VKRDEFPMLEKSMHGKPLIYFDTAATAQKPRCVIDAVRDFYTHSYGTVHRAVYELASEATEAHHRVRQKTAAFLNAAGADEIIFTKGTTEAINLVASSFGKAFVRPGDEILITEIEHHANIVPWQILCEERGAKLRAAPVNDRGELDLDAFSSLLNEKTKLVAIAHISNVIGTLHPVKKITALAHEAGAKVLIDGAQGAGTLPVDLRDIGCDFYVFSGHKLYGPTGVGVLYGKRELLEAMPPYQGGGDMIREVTLEKTTYNAVPLKFEAGTPMIAQIIGLGAALDFLSEIGMEKIYLHGQSLAAKAVEALKQIPKLRLTGDPERRGPIISFMVEGAHPLDIGTLLDLQGVALRTGHHCAQPAMRRFGVEATARLSFGLYNSPEEVDRFIEALTRVVGQCASC